MRKKIKKKELPKPKLAISVEDTMEFESFSVEPRSEYVTFGLTTFPSRVTDYEITIVSSHEFARRLSTLLSDGHEKARMNLPVEGGTPLSLNSVHLLETTFSSNGTATVKARGEKASIK